VTTKGKISFAYDPGVPAQPMPALKPAKPVIVHWQRGEEVYMCDTSPGGQVPGDANSLCIKGGAWVTVTITESGYKPFVVARDWRLSLSVREKGKFKSEQEVTLFDFHPPWHSRCDPSYNLNVVLMASDGSQGKAIVRVVPPKYCSKKSD